MAFLRGREPVDRTEGEVPARRGDLQDAEALASHPVFTGPNTSSQLVALRQLEYLSGEQGHAYEAASSPRKPLAPIPASETQDQHDGRTAGRHHASRSRRDQFLRRHATRFASFSVIGGGIFVAGLLLQALLTSGLHVPSLISYIMQAVISVEASYFLNRWFTWKGTRTPLWSSFLRYNLQKAVTVTVNFILYGLLLKVGVEYLLDNVLLTIVFTFVNYIGADKLVFLRGSKQIIAAVTGPLTVLTGPLPKMLDEQRAVLPRRTWRGKPSISVVIPVRSNEKTIRAAVESILDQDYPVLHELILVGSPGDSTWSALRGIDDRRVFIHETETPAGIRDANFKRHLGITESSCELVALIDSDMVLPRDWMSNAVHLLMENEVDCVAGVMRSIRDDFWGRFVDRNRLGAKTPRAESAYLVTAEGFGAAGFKPPITADILFTRRMYQDCPIDSSWRHGSLEDYEWFWRVVERGHHVLVSDELYGWHHHRAGLKNLAREYRRSARGCAFFIRAHRDSPFAQKRMTQAILLPLAVFSFMAAIAAASYMHDGKIAAEGLAAIALAGVAFLSVREFVRSRTLESLIYPIPALALGINYTASLSTHLIRSTPMQVAPVAYGFEDPAEKTLPWHRALLRRVAHPLTLILAFQAGIALSLAWSNTGFSDEMDYMWAGATLINHVRYGTAWPTQYTHTTLSGLPFLYPPLGALANMIGGLPAARLLSMCFMLCSTGFVYTTAKLLYGRGTGLCAAGFWVTFAPALQLSAFATFDGLSVALTACAAWLVVRTATSPKLGEMVALSGVVLGIAGVTAYSGLVMIPVVVIFAMFVWMSSMSFKQAAACAAWFGAAAGVTFAVIMTVCKTWPGITTTVLARQVNTAGYSSASHVFHDSWSYIGIVAIFAAVGAVFALSSGDRKLGAQTLYLAAIALVIPIAQAHETTAVSLRKHLAYSGIFAVMAAGYGLTRFAKSLPAKRWAVVACCLAAFIAPAVDGIDQTLNWYHSWPDASSLVAKLQPYIGSHQVIAMGLGANNYLCYYEYANLGSLWETNCIQGVTLSTARSMRAQYIVLGYQDFVEPASGLPADLLLSPQADRSSFLKFLGEENTPNSPQNPDLAELSQFLETSGKYKLVAVGPYDSDQSAAVYTIWQRVSPSQTAVAEAVKS